MGLSNGVHHLAIGTADIKKQIEFFTDVLGMELVALYWMHGVDGCYHGFVELSGESYIAFVQHPENAKEPEEEPRNAHQMGAAEGVRKRRRNEGLLRLRE